MWQIKLKLWGRIVILALLLLPIIYINSGNKAEAATSDQVTVTATGLVVGAPGGFTVYYISDYEVGISWAKPEDAVNTMIRAKYSDYPTAPAHGYEPTDGYLVYYGPAENASDTAVSLDETATPVYYRAWCEDAEGNWSPLYGEGEMEGIGMVLIALIILAIGFMVLSYVFKRMEMMFAGAGAWIVLGFYAFTRSESSSPAQITDIYMGLFWLCIGLTITCALLPMAMRQKPGMLEPEAPEDESDRMSKEYEEFEKEMTPFRFRSRRAKPKLSRFARKGEE